MKKKAIIGITTETLVILILAIVFLGLALVFFSYIFKDMNINVKDIFDSVTKQKIENLKMSEKTFDIELYTTEIKAGEKKIIFMLLRNKGNDENYVWKLTSEATNITNNINCNNISLSYKPEVNILPGQESTPPLLIKTEKNIKQGTCLFEIKAIDSNDNAEIIDLTINII